MREQDDQQRRAPQTAVTIRRASPADASGIATVMGAITAQRIHSAIDRAWSAGEEERYLVSLSARETVHVAVRPTDGIVGYAEPGAVVVRHDLDGPRRPGRDISAAGLAASRHRQPVVERHRAFGRDAGYRKLVIQVRGSNTNAQAFYQGLGFRVCRHVGRQVVIDGVEDDEVLMELFV